MGAVPADSDESVIQLALLDPKLHRALLEQLDEGVCMLDLNHRIVYWNSGAEDLYGWHRDPQAPGQAEPHLQARGPEPAGQT